MRCLFAFVCFINILLSVDAFQYRSNFAKKSISFATKSKNLDKYSRNLNGISILSSLILSPVSENLSEPVNPGPVIKFKGKYLLNIWGIYCALVTFTLASVVLPVMMLSAFVSDLRGNSKVICTFEYLFLCFKC